MSTYTGQVGKVASRFGAFQFGGYVASGIPAASLEAVGGRERWFALARVVEWVARRYPARWALRGQRMTNV